MSFDNGVSTLSARANKGVFVFSQYTIVNPPLSQILITVMPITEYIINQNNFINEINPMASVSI